MIGTLKERPPPVINEMVCTEAIWALRLSIGQYGQHNHVHYFEVLEVHATCQAPEAPDTEAESQALGDCWAAVSGGPFRFLLGGASAGSPSERVPFLTFCLVGRVPLK